MKSIYFNIGLNTADLLILSIPHLFITPRGGGVRIHWNEGRPAYLPDNTASHFIIIAVRTPNRTFWKNNLTAQVRCIVTVYFTNVFGCFFFFNLHYNPGWVSTCSTVVEHSQKEGFTECRCQRHVKPPTWRTTSDLERSSFRHKRSPASEATQANPAAEGGTMGEKWVFECLAFRIKPVCNLTNERQCQSY
jgi:hypothetical protein